MAKQSVIARSKKKPKFSTRIVRRCWKCGRKRGYMRKFNLCRICFRELANDGKLPGVENQAGKYVRITNKREYTNIIKHVQFVNSYHS